MGGSERSTKERLSLGGNHIGRKACGRDEGGSSGPSLPT